MIHSLRRALTRLWRRREPEQRCPDCKLTATRIGEMHILAQRILAADRPRHAARDHDQPDFDPRPDDVLAGRS